MHVFYYDLDDDYLKTIGLKSGSAFINNFNWFIFLVILVLFNLLFVIFYKLFFNKLKLYPKTNKILSWMLKLFILNIYIRIMLESNQFWLITSINEAKKIQIKSDNKLYSFIIACWLLVVTIKFNLIVIYLAFWSFRNETKVFPTIFEEFFKGNKSSKIANLHSCLQTFRKTFTVALLMMLDQLNIYTMHKINIE